MVSEGVGYESWVMGYKYYIYDQLALKPLKLALELRGYNYSRG
jgi:hypothetical protein